MRLFKSLYLTDRVFYALGLNVFTFFAAYNFPVLFDISIGLLIIILLIIIVDCSIIYSRKNSLQIKRMTPNILSLGDENVIKISLTNTTPLVLNVKIVDELPCQFEIRDFEIIEHLSGYQKKMITYPLIPYVRGEYSFGNTNVLIGTKLFFIQKREKYEVEEKAVVYPSIIQMKKQELLTLNHPSFKLGEKKIRKMGKSYEFDQIKNYIPGDDPRNINWKATSRTYELMTNHFEEERSQQVYSVIDKSRVMEMPFDGLSLLDYAINTSLALSNIVLKKQDNAGLITYSENVDTFLKADSSVKQLKKIMYSLYKESYHYSEANFEALYTTIRQSIPNRSLLFLYTNFDSIYSLERVIPILRMINRYHLLVVVFFENTELESYSKEKVKSVIDIYQQTIAKKFILEKEQITKEMERHGIQSITCKPEQLSTYTINKYLKLKSIGSI